MERTAIIALLVAFATTVGRGGADPGPRGADSELRPTRAQEVQQGLDGSDRIVVRVFSDGLQQATFDGNQLGFSRDASWTAFDESFESRGRLSGEPALEDVRFFRLGARTVAVQDVYLSDAPSIELVGRSLPVLLDGESNARAAASPTVSSLGGSTDGVSVANGRISVGSCGANYNSLVCLNGQNASNSLTNTVILWLNGANFGTSPGTVTAAGRSAGIVSWSPTQVKFVPTVPYTSGPMSTTVVLKTSSGASVTYGISAAPVLISRCYGQCTFHVAKTRLAYGLLPSPTAYGGYASITGAYVPTRGDQMQWNGAHTAIVSAVSARLPASDGTRTWDLTVSEQNADCQNGIRTYATTFKSKAGAVVAYPKSSIASFGNCTKFFR